MPAGPRWVSTCTVNNMRGPTRCAEGHLPGPAAPAGPTWWGKTARQPTRRSAAQEPSYDEATLKWGDQSEPLTSKQCRLDDWLIHAAPCHLSAGSSPDGSFWAWAGSSSFHLP